MIALCLTADMYSMRRCSGGPPRDPQTRQEMEEVSVLWQSVAFPETTD
jgi:hypothetical protein